MSVVELPPPTAESDELDRLVEDFPFYAETCLRIQTKAGDLVPLILNRAQSVAETKVTDQLARTGRIRALILKARQEGLSTWVAARIYQGCTLHFNRNALILADKTARSEALFKISERYYDHSPREIRPVRKTSRKAREMLFNTLDGQGLDSQIAVETAGDTEAGRSLTRWYIHASEFAFWPHAADTLTALLSTVPQSSGEIYIESTANGVGNEFHEMWEAAKDGTSGWLAIFLPWWIHEEYTRGCSPDERTQILASIDPWERMALEEGIDWEGESWKLLPEQLAWRRSKIAEDFAGDSRRFRQEFPSTDIEAFLVSGSAFFDEEALLTYRGLTRRPLQRANFVAKGGGWFPEPTERGWVEIWEKPDPDGHYVLAADTAEGKVAAARDASLSDPENERGGRDYNSADVLKVSEMKTVAGKKIRVPCLRQVAHVHGYMAPEVFATQIYAASVWWSCPGGAGQTASRRPCLVAVERNHSSGQTTIRELRDTHHHPDLYVHRQMNVRKGRPTTQIGWVTDGTTRMPMLDELATLIRQGGIEILNEFSIRECFMFVRGDDGRPEAQEGAHDDRVISLAIACQMVHHHRDEPKGQLPELEVADTPTGV